MRFKRRRRTKKEIEENKFNNRWWRLLIERERALRKAEQALSQSITHSKDKTMNSDTQEKTEGTQVLAPLLEETALAQSAETVSDLATLGARGMAIIESRREVVDTAVRASISLTYPQDWILFRDKDTGRIIAYLQDSGCARISKVWGIQTEYKSLAKQESDDKLSFSWKVTGNAFCKLTGQYLNDEEGVRCSTEAFITQVKEPMLKDTRVKQAAKANFNGSCVRRLTGMQSIPIEMLDEVWKGSGKTSAKCVQGKGFGSAAERQGAKVQQSADTPAGEEPTCELCGGKMYFKPAGKTAQGKEYSAFWFCPEGGEGRRHEKSTLSHSDWQKTVKTRTETREPGMEA